MKYLNLKLSDVIELNLKLSNLTLTLLLWQMVTFFENLSETESFLGKTTDQSTGEDSIKSGKKMSNLFF